MYPWRIQYIMNTLLDKTETEKVTIKGYKLNSGDNGIIDFL